MRQKRKTEAPCTIVFSAWIATARMYSEIQSMLVFTLSLAFSFLSFSFSFLTSLHPWSTYILVANINMAALLAAVAAKCLFAKKQRRLVMSSILTWLAQAFGETCHWAVHMWDNFLSSNFGELCNTTFKSQWSADIEWHFQWHVVKVCKEFIARACSCAFSFEMRWLNLNHMLNGCQMCQPRAKFTHRSHF